MSTPKFTAPETPVTREEVYYDAILRGLNGDSPAPVIPTPVWRMEEYLAAIAEAASSGGSSLPSVTSADNGKVLAVEDGAWAADSNLFLVTMPTYNTADKTYDETVAAIEAGKTVMILRSGRYYSFLERSSDTLYFVGNVVNSTNLTFGKLSVIHFKKTSISTANTLQFLNSPVAADNGSELIVKNGAWAMQKKKFVVTLTPTSLDYSGTMDHTVAEINAAYEAGQEIWFKVLTSASTSVEIPLTYWATDSSYDYHGFSANIVQVAANMLIVAYVSSTSDGTTQTYSTKVYSLTPAS